MSRYFRLPWLVAYVNLDPDNTRRYGAAVAHQAYAGHRRTGSISHHLEGLPPGPEIPSLPRAIGTPNTVDADVFPPPRAQAPDPSIFLPYVTEDIAFEEEYEEYLSDLGWSDQPQVSEGPFAPSSSAWSRLPEFATDIADGISDSESIASIGELGDDARVNADREGGEVPDENLNNWEVRASNTRTFHVLIFLCLAHESKNYGGTHQVASRSASVKFWGWSTPNLTVRP